jgi:alpha-L-fucosidase
MKSRGILTATLLPVLSGLVAPVHGTEPYTSDSKSLRRHQVPQWAKDAKFGIYGHWGVYSQVGRWDLQAPNNANLYACSYIQIYRDTENEFAREFEKRVGPLTKGFGYKDLAKQFKPVKFDPAQWADLIQKSGARYAGIAAVHHDGYCLWDSSITDFCAGKMGPKRDLYGELVGEIRKRGIKTFASFHHERSHKHFMGLHERLLQKKVTGVDLLDEKTWGTYWFMGTEDHFARKRHELTVEVIDKYKPDMIWFDGGGGEYGTERALADFFNMGLKENKEVCVQNKGNFGDEFGLYSYENGIVRPDYVAWPWADDTPSGTRWDDWPWHNRIEYKKPRDVVVRLCDLVARNGGLLLSLNPTPEGELEQGQVDLLLGVGKWLGQNGEAIYGTVPWKIFAEGFEKGLEFRDKAVPGGQKETVALRPDVTKLDWKCVRFTRKGNDLYAIVLGVPPAKEVVIKSLANGTAIGEPNRIKSVELLGHGRVSWKRSDDGLTISLPEKLPNEWALAFKIIPEGGLDQNTPLGMSSKRKQRSTVR